MGPSPQHESAAAIGQARIFYWTEAPDERMLCLASDSMEARMKVEGWTFAGIPDSLATALRASRKLAVAIAGACVLATGLLMLVLPGPAFVVIPAGLAILGVEFAWARRWLRHVKEHGERAFRFWRRGREARS